MPNPAVLPVAAVTLLLSAGLASAADVTLSIRNQSSETIQGVNIYPIDASDGEIIDDNISGPWEPLAPGAAGSIRITGDRCGKIFVRFTFPAGDRELDTRLDTCADRILVLRDR